MGDLVDLAAYRVQRARAARATGAAGPFPRPTFYFDLASPLSYLAAERVERLLGSVEWVPSGPLGDPPALDRVAAEREALAVRLPLVWPERVPLRVPSAQRAAAFAAECGRAAAFALAASRLAFCGGFDLEDPEILADAAAAAGIAPEACLAAAGDERWDRALAATARELRELGIEAAPAIRVGQTWRSGAGAVAEAAALVAHRRASLVS